MKLTFFILLILLIHQITAANLTLGDTKKRKEESKSNIPDVLKGLIKDNREGS